MNLKELYQEIILDHGKNPRNLRKTDNFNKDAKFIICDIGGGYGGLLRLLKHYYKNSCP